MIEFSEALQLILNQAHSFGTEKIGIDNALGRILAKNIYSDRDYPPFNRASMDGYAVRFQDFEKEIRNFKLIETIYAGESTDKVIEKGECYKIMTGAAVPLSADFIVRVEDSKIEHDSSVSLIDDNINKYKNIAKQGEDTKQGNLVLSKGNVINAAIWATLAVLGKAEIEVQKLPKVAIITTGNEIKQVFEPVNSVQIRDSNSFTIKALLNKFKIDEIEKYNVKDEKLQIEEVLSKALKNDILIITGGVSAGDADYIPETLQKIGVQKIFHKVKIKPGKPIWFGITENKAVVFALPGNPFSVQVACKIFLEPFLNACFQTQLLKNETHIYTGTERIKINQLDEFLPSKFNYNTLGLELCSFNGSGDISAILNSDGLILHSNDSKNLVYGNKVFFYRF